MLFNMYPIKNVKVVTESLKEQIFNGTLHMLVE